MYAQVMEELGFARPISDIFRKKKILFEDEIVNLASLPDKYFTLPKYNHH